MIKNYIKDNPYVTLFQSGKEILYPKTGFYMPTIPIACQAKSVNWHINMNRYFISVILIFIHLAVCLTTGPKPLPKQAVHIVRSRASSFKWEYPLLSLRSSNSFLRLLPCLPVTFIPPCIFPSVTRCRRQFLHQMWPIQFASRLRISCRVFLCSLTLNNTNILCYK